MNLSQRARVFLLLLALLLVLGAIGLAALLRDWISDVLVVYIAYYLWWISQAIRSRPQMMFWVLPIILGTVSIILMLAAAYGDSQDTGPAASPVGRVADWAEYLDLASVQHFARRYLRRKFENLARGGTYMNAPPVAGRDYVIQATLAPDFERLLDTCPALSDSRVRGADMDAWLESVADYLEAERI